MPNFIELHVINARSKEKILLNLDDVQVFYQNENGTTSISIRNFENDLTVMEGMRAIKNKISPAKNQPSRACL